MSDTTYYGVVAEFETAADIYQAAERVTDAGYRRVDAHTPFAVHGMEKALKQRDSHVGWICAFMGLAGIGLAQLMMWWMNGHDYPFVVAGKRPYDWPTTIPITFECMVLLASFGALFGMLGLNRLPRLNHPVFNHPTFHRAADDRFFLSVEATDPKFDRVETVKFLKSLGGKHVELVED
jgi:hypothetical protein